MSPVLRLSLMGPSDDPPDQRGRMLTSGALKIGRDESNDWVLDDDSRLISRHHCTITSTGGVFVVIDSSANGVFVNDAQQPLGRGNSSILSEGDVLRIGHIGIAVSVAETFGEVADPFRAILPPLRNDADAGFTRQDDLDDFGLPPAAAPSMNVPSQGASGRPPPSLHPFRSAKAEPDWEHVPIEQQALQPMRVVGVEIPDDWNEDIDPSPPPSKRALPVLPSEEQPTVGPKKITLALVEALARIERAVLNPGEERLLSGSVEEALARLEDGDLEWTALALEGLALRTVARLGETPSGAENVGGEPMSDDWNPSAVAVGREGNKA
ncbi:FHA domain-containing protein [Aquabacter sp. CN5-332]|uniref:type VI secretion system-associated FHA domain protein n=1 Tax=Aquabacter sp. CN5-332 TaxID=3156608 RepID=UPI0032B4A1A3